MQAGTLRQHQNPGESDAHRKQFAAPRIHAKGQVDEHEYQRHHGDERNHEA
jgi:hypothetical protein